MHFNVRDYVVDSSRLQSLLQIHLGKKKNALQKYFIRIRTNSGVQ